MFRFTQKRWKFLRRVIFSFVGVLFGSWLLIISLKLQKAASQPVDAFFVLGGSIRREMYVAQQAKQFPQTKILISKGSDDPCIWIIFDRDRISKKQVWLEKCANSTFENFFYSVPILKEWGIKHVKLITSATHLPRAKWLAQIHFGVQGIWVEPEIVPEIGVPANSESRIKTGLDVLRSLFWSLVSPIIQPQCHDLIPLEEIDIPAWRKTGFKCEYQGAIPDDYFDGIVDGDNSQSAPIP